MAEMLARMDSRELSEWSLYYAEMDRLEEEELAKHGDGTRPPDLTRGYA